MATAKRDLWTGVTLWNRQMLRGIAVERLERDIAVDVLVIGAGISGAMVAEALSDDGMSVAIVDRRGAAKGSTSASTALVQYEIDEPLTALSRRIGEADAIRAWRRSFAALQGLRARVRELALVCDLETRDSLYLAGDRLGPDALRREGFARREAGIETVYLSRQDLKQRFGIRRAAALLGFGNLSLDPRRLTLGFLKAASERGARLYSPVSVTTVEPGARRVLAATEAGPVIRCRHLIFATGYELPSYVVAGHHQMISTYAMATAPQFRRLWPERCFIWEASDPYLYMRTTADGRIIAGGEDEDFADEEKRDALLPRKIARISRKISRLFPDVDARPAFAWAGTFGSTDTGLPTIGLIPGMKNCWAVLGYGGNGITYSRVAAEILRTQLRGDADPDADLFAFPKRRRGGK